MAETPDTARASASVPIPTTTTTASASATPASAIAATTALVLALAPTPTTTTTHDSANSTNSPSRTAGPSLDRRSPPSGPLLHSTYHAHRQNHNPSKLPTFRFTDLRNETLNRPSLTHGIPSPVSPAETRAAEAQTRQPGDVCEATRAPSPPSLTGHHNHHHQSASHNHHDPSVSHDASSVANTAAAARQSNANPVPPRLPAFQFTANSTPQPPATPKSLKRSSSSAQLTSDDLRSSATDSTDTIVAPPRPLRKRVSSHSWSAANSLHEASRRPVANHHRLRSTGSIQRPSDNTGTPRDLLVLKTVERTASDDKRSSISRRPPLSYKPITAASPSTGGTASIPPIRSFRSSGSRRSFGLDMNLRSPRGYDDEPSNGNHRDQTLRALEGRQDDDATIRWVPPSAGAADRPDADDDSGDVFLKMAREEPDGKRAPAVSRIARSAHRRPLSTAVVSYKPTSPPPVLRRLSEQEGSAGNRAYGGDQTGDRAPRAANYRRDQDLDEAKTRGQGTPLRPSTFKPPTLSTQDFFADAGSKYSRNFRRSSITESNSGTPSRMSSLKQTASFSSGPGRPYNSSPLVPKPAEAPKQDTHTGDHQTESSNSTAAPSTVWDELDELKSRIHRLELTGKLPATSGAAMSRASDERPPTATTNATTMSVSPKRESAGATKQNDATSAVSQSNKEGHPLLQSALNKSKPFLTTNVYDALETAANDALSLSLMFGAAGQPGPISSAASAVGAGNAVTTRQLRRKADSICRSLTELCVALSENTAQLKPPASAAKTPEPEHDGLPSPTGPRFGGAATQSRHASGAADRNPASIITSPRAMTRLEERRNSLLQGSALPSPATRYSSGTPATPTEAHGRRTSLMLPRARRAVTEEPEQQQPGRKSSILRTRRAGTEDPDDAPSRSISLLRTRRAMAEEEGEESRFRAPSRAITEVASARNGAATREYTSQVPLPSVETSPVSAVIPRRRPVPTTLSTRVIQPQSSTNSLSARRYIERTTPDRSNDRTTDRATERAADREPLSATARLTEERGQRQFSFPSVSRIARAGSLAKRGTRESLTITSPTTAQGR